MACQAYERQRQPHPKRWSLNSIWTARSSHFTIGRLYPAPGRYCFARVEVGRRDELSRYLQGHFKRGEDWTFFQFFSQGTADLVISLSAPLELSAQQRSGVIEMSLAYQDWFHGLDFKSPADDGQTTIVFQNVIGSIYDRSESEK